jgi:hypothetical protein
MGKYDNYSNIKNVEKARKKLEKLVHDKKPDINKIRLAQEELKTAMMFTSCQIFKSWKASSPNESVMFSDDNRVMMFNKKLIHYEDIASYEFVEINVDKSRTVTKQRGAVSRAIVGGAIAGGVGAMVGAMTADSHSETTYYKEGNGFTFHLFLKDGSSHQCWIMKDDTLARANKLHPLWVELAAKLQRIIDGKE